MVPGGGEGGMSIGGALTGAQGGRRPAEGREPSTEERAESGPCRPGLGEELALNLRLAHGLPGGRGAQTSLERERV